MTGAEPSGDAAYQARLRRELASYEDVAEVHELPPAHHYVTQRYLGPLLEGVFGYGDYPGMILRRLGDHPRSGDGLEVLSLGSGNADAEIDLVAANGLDCRVTCTELNPRMLERAAALARERGVADRFRFVECDVNRLELDQTYDVVLANHSLHHFVALEHVFDEVAAHMASDSVFLINDMIGRNGHAFWPGTLDLANRLWDALPADIKHNRLTGRDVAHRFQGECGTDGFEGVRAQDILPLLDQRFYFQNFAPFFTLINRFTDRDFGPNFDLDDPLHRAFLDWAIQLDDYCLRERLLRPTQMLAALRLPGTSIAPRALDGMAPADVYTLPADAVYARFTPPALPVDDSVPQPPLVKRAGQWATQWPPARRAWESAKQHPSVARAWDWAQRR